MIRWWLSILFVLAACTDTASSNAPPRAPVTERNPAMHTTTSTGASSGAIGGKGRAGEHKNAFRH